MVKWTEQIVSVFGALQNSGQPWVVFIKVGRTAQSVERTQIWEKMQQVERKAQVHNAKLG